MHLSRPSAAWPSESKPIAARRRSFFVQESDLRLYTTSWSPARGAKHSSRLQRKPGRYGARHGAAQWLSPRRDAISDRDPTELIEHYYSARGLQHCHIDSFRSWSCRAPRTSPAPSSTCWMTMMPWRESDHYARWVHDASVSATGKVPAQLHAWKLRLSALVLFVITDPYACCWCLRASSPEHCLARSLDRQITW